MIRFEDDRWIRRAGIADTKTAHKGKLCDIAARSRLQRVMRERSRIHARSPRPSERPLRAFSLLVSCCGSMSQGGLK